jgi:hypothetical protein
MIETTTYTLPAYWACALINGDESGMDDDEIKELNEWLSAFNPGLCLDCSEESEFCHSHDADGYALAGDCLTFTFSKD